jgi:hypothetical protein
MITAQRVRGARLTAGLSAMLLGIALVGASLLLSGPATAAQQKVGVCHRTASDTNPYVYIEVPAAQANGHITGTAKNHKKPREWKSDGTWRGVPHQEGDPKEDYLAPGGSDDCEDTSTTPSVSPSESISESTTPSVNPSESISDSTQPTVNPSESFGPSDGPQGTTPTVAPTEAVPTGVDAGTAGSDGTNGPVLGLVGLALVVAGAALALFGRKPQGKHEV